MVKIIKLKVAIYTLAIAFSYINPDKAAAIDCSVTQTVTVPFTWLLTQTTGINKNNISVFQRNDGPTGNVEASAAPPLQGSFTLTKRHNPPSLICSGPTPALPTKVTLDLSGKLTGTYANTTLGLDIHGVPFETYLRVTPSLDLVSGLSQESFGTGSGDFLQLKTAVQQVGEGTIPYTGSLNVQSKFGFGGQNLDYITSFSQLIISGSLRDPITTQHTYEVPISEPLTILGTGVVLGAIPVLKKEYAKKNKKKDEDV